MTASHLTRRLTWLGGINVTCFAAYTVLSYGLAPIAFHELHHIQRQAMFGALAQTLDFLGSDVRAFVSGQSVLTRGELWLIAYSLPQVLSSGVFLVLLLSLARQRQNLDVHTPQRLFRWAVAWAVLCIPAAPVLVQDLWWSVAWGRMVAAGLNPYHADLTPIFAGDLPIGKYAGYRMTYGPLWAVASGVVMWLAGERLWMAALLFKLLLTGAWIGCLRLIWLLLQRQPLWHQCVGILLCGWLPLSVVQTVADGHNDVCMVFLLLLWLYTMTQGRPIIASLALAASVLIKYVTAPLFLLDLLYVLYTRKERGTAYLPQMIAAVSLIGVTFGVFWRSPDFFTPALSMRRWPYFAPSEAVVAVGELVGVKLHLVGGMVCVFFLLLPLYFIARYCRQPDTEAFWKAALALMSGVLFSRAVGHVWPWFILWVLGVAALLPGAVLTRWIVGVGLAAPFPLLSWTVFPSDVLSGFLLPALGLHTFAVLWLAFAPRRWFPPDPPTDPVDPARGRSTLGLLMSLRKMVPSVDQGNVRRSAV